ncbi:MAG: hypothetical protein J5828_04550 [Desulfovibrionaceae bacterium]|nr:hypothetical protein [Desulfovibrionaceae bacterium]
MKAFPAFILAILALSALSAYARPLQDYPEARGKVWKSLSYSDRLGRHTVILSRKSYASQPSKNDRDFICSNEELYGCDYIKSKTKPRLLWRMRDHVHDCPTSARAEFSPDSPVITDLNGNGISEVWITYYIGCHGDVSPDGMKILMYEGGKKYALRGETFVHVDGMDLGGNYKADPAFAGAPAPFLRFADKLWQKNMRR